MLPPRFSIFGGGDPKPGPKSQLPAPSLNLRTDREVYHPGDPVIATVEISCPGIVDHPVLRNGGACSLLIKRLGFEIKGIEKLDPQWFATQKPSPDSKQRRGNALPRLKLQLWQTVRNWQHQSSVVYCSSFCCC